MDKKNIIIFKPSALLNLSLFDPRWKMALKSSVDFVQILVFILLVILFHLKLGLCDQCIRIAREIFSVK